MISLLATILLLFGHPVTIHIGDNVAREFTKCMDGPGRRGGVIVEIWRHNNLAIEWWGTNRPIRIREFHDLQETTLRIYECYRLDLDHDGDVDLKDYAEWQNGR